MSNLKNKQLDFFSKQMFERYEITENHARSLFDRWNVIEKKDEADLIAFIESDDVQRAFFIKNDINIAKKYTSDDLKKAGITLNEVDSEKHLYRDSKYNFLWEELYHNMADCWTGYYKIKDPIPSDTHLLRKEQGY